MQIQEIKCGRCMVVMTGGIAAVKIEESIMTVYECPTCGQKVFVYLKDLIEKEEKKPLKQYGRRVTEITDFFGGKK